MKNKLSISLIAVALSCSFAFIAYAANTESEEDLVSMELSENEIKAIHKECTEIAVENDLQDDELITYVDECFAANTMVFEDLSPEEADLAEEDQEIPVLEDEADMDSEDPIAETDEESSEEIS